MSLWSVRLEKSEADDSLLDLGTNSTASDSCSVSTVHVNFPSTIRPEPRIYRDKVIMLLSNLRRSRGIVLLILLSILCYMFSSATSAARLQCGAFIMPSISYGRPSRHETGAPGPLYQQGRSPCFAMFPSLPNCLHTPSCSRVRQSEH